MAPTAIVNFEYRPNEGLPFSAYQRLRESGPVLWSEALGGWLVSSFSGVRTILSDVTRFTSEGTPIAAAAGAEAMLVTDTPSHDTLRAIWVKRVSGPAIAARMQELEGNAARVLSAVQEPLAAGEVIDFIPLFRQFVMAFIGASFAIPQDRLDVFQLWSRLSADTPAIELAENSPALERHLVAKNRVLDLVREQVEDRRQRFRRHEQPDDLISLMVAAEGQPGITPAIVVDNVFNFVLGAMDTTEKWLGNILVRFFGHPGLLAEIRANRRLIEPLLQEAMRFDTVAQVIQRRVRHEDVNLSEARLRAGDQIYLMLGAANRDPAEFENADSFDLHRRVKLNLGFGFGFHQCLGFNIAKQEAMAFIAVLLDKLPNLHIAGCDYGTSWALWGPRALQIDLGNS